MSERKPSWLTRITKPGNLSKIVARKCDGCKRWTIQCRENVWESYDAGIIAGDDLTIAIILGKPLVRIRRIPALDQISLLSTFGAAGIDPQGEYLALHDCKLGIISSRPLIFPRHVDPADEMAWPNIIPLPDPTDPLAARRALIANANAGMSREQALAKALESARGKRLPAAPEKPKPTNNHHFAGRLGLADIIGKETK